MLGKLFMTSVLGWCDGPFIKPGCKAQLEAGWREQLAQPWLSFPPMADSKGFALVFVAV